MLRLNWLRSKGRGLFVFVAGRRGENTLIKSQAGYYPYAPEGLSSGREAAWSPLLVMTNASKPV